MTSGARRVIPSSEGFIPGRSSTLSSGPNVRLHIAYHSVPQYSAFMLPPCTTYEPKKQVPEPIGRSEGLQFRPNLSEVKGVFLGKDREIGLAKG
jgi:hypothetical protein